MFLKDWHRRLPSELEYVGEFGPELVLFLPYLNWLSAAGLLKRRSIVTYRGMRCFYEPLHCAKITEKAGPRHYVPPHLRKAWLPVRNEHDFDGKGRPARHLYPDLRAQFGRLPLSPAISSSGRPLLIIHNKHNDEWNRGPVNHIGLDCLRKLFGALMDEFTIVYIRHGMLNNAPDFVDDHNTSLAFDDLALLRQYPGVLCFDELYAQHRALGGLQDSNTFKNVLYSRCFRFISSQGGGAHHIALYSGVLLAILHRSGIEENWAYGRGYYGFMATVPPCMAVCRTEDDLLAACRVFSGSTVVDERIYVDARNADILSRYSPRTIADRPPSPSTR